MAWSATNLNLISDSDVSTTKDDLLHFFLLVMVHTKVVGSVHNKSFVQHYRYVLSIMASCHGNAFYITGPVRGIHQLLKDLSMMYRAL